MGEIERMGGRGERERDVDGRIYKNGS